MNLCDTLFKHTEKIWESYLVHPFVNGIGTGNLDKEAFKFYMVQDYLYLLEYAKVFSLGVVKSDKEEIMRGMSDCCNNILNGEMEIHKHYMEMSGIGKKDILEAKPSLLNTSYTSYMTAVAQKGDILDLSVAILSCVWSYNFIGKRLVEAYPASSRHEFYGRWVSGYSGDDFTNFKDWVIEFINEVGRDISEEKMSKLKEIFYNCSVYEYKFWDMAYTLDSGGI